MDRKWYVHKMRDGYCEVNPSPAWNGEEGAVEHWGPFNSQDEAISKRAELVKQKICLPNGD